MIPAISSNGQFVAFSSNGASFGVTPPSSVLELYVQDQSQLPRETELVSIDSSGQPGDAHSFFSSISDDGRFVAFLTEADNLVEKWNEDLSVPVIRDRLNHLNICAAWDQNAQACWPGGPPKISADGEWAAFIGWDALIAEDTNTLQDVYLYQVSDQSLRLVSRGPNGELSNQYSGTGNISISADGRFVAYSSAASNLVSNDVNEEVDIFVFDRLTGQNEIVTVNSTTEQAIGHQFPVGGPNLAISSDGRFVAFFSSAENLDLRDNNGVLDLFVRDRLYQTTRRVLVPRKADSPHELYVGNEISLTITSDGQEVLFGSEADWLVPEDSNSSLDFFTVHQNQQAYFQIQVVIDPSWRLYLPIMFR